MSQNVCRVHIRKESLKFASAHMTVFPDGSKEALHGHNYFTEVSFYLRDISLKGMIPFSTLKGFIREICESWDEKVLLPEKCPFFELKSKSANEVEFLLCGKRYVLPADEVIFLPVDNVTSESLSEQFSQQLLVRLRSILNSGIISQFDVRIEESPGQGATSSVLF